MISGREISAKIRISITNHTFSAFVTLMLKSKYLLLLIFMGLRHLLVSRDFSFISNKPEFLHEADGHGRGQRHFRGGSVLMRTLASARRWNLKMSRLYPSSVSVYPGHLNLTSILPWRVSGSVNGFALRKSLLSGLFRLTKESTNRPLLLLGHRQTIHWNH